MTIRHPLRLLPAVLLATLVFAGGARADTVETSLGAIDGLQILGVKDGRLQYKNTNTGATGDKQLGQVKGIKVDAVPAVAPAMKALADKDDKAAVRTLFVAIAKARASRQKEWLVPYLQFQLLGCHKRMGDAVAAAQVYCEMVQAKGDSYYFAEAPGTAADKTLESLVKAADENARKAIFARVQDTRKAAAAEFTAPLDQLAGATGITVEAPPAAPGPDGAAPGAANPGAAKPGAAVVAQSGALLLTTRVLRTIQENSAEAGDMQLAVAGRYTQAVTAMRAALAAKTTLTGTRLYVLGRVQQELAEQEKDPVKKDVLLKEAALCFLRVGAQFHEEGQGYYEPSLLEAARIHQAWGNPKAVEKLMADLGDYGDSQEDPAYAKRYADFKASLEKK